uniref:Putative radical SAM superfamily protein n=1 Tax=viral metagenome TaxID=1070528 RepID=A0A6M3JB83_9ZZZZ
MLDCDVSIVDAYKDDMSEKDFTLKLKELKPDIVGITVLFDQYGPSGHLAAELTKKVDKKIKVVMGGVYATTNVELVLTDKNIDAVVEGEGEYMLRYLVGLHRMGRWNEQIHLKGSRIYDLDSIPLPAYNLIDFSKYSKSAERKSVDSPRLLPYARIMTSRGCPMGCSFCQVKIIAGQEFRPRSSESVLKEIRWLKETYGIKSLIFDDDNLLHDKKRAKEIFQGMIDRNLVMPWVSIGLAVFKLDKDMLDLMKASGCEYIAVAIESGTKRILKIINKPVNFDYARKMVSYAREIGIYVAANFIVGFPTETWDEIRQTLNFAEDIGVDYAKIFHLVPLPHTEIWDMCGGSNNKFKWSKGNIESKEFTSDDLTILRAYEWDRINFSEPEKRKRTAKMMGVSEDELNTIRRDTLNNACNLVRS